MESVTPWVGGREGGDEGGRDRGREGGRAREREGWMGESKGWRDR